jgi:biopolymer transport protein ExbB
MRAIVTLVMMKEAEAKTRLAVSSSSYKNFREKHMSGFIFAAAESDASVLRQLLVQGGTTLIILIVMSVLCVTLFVYLYLNIRPETVAPKAVMEEMEKLARSKDHQGLHRVCATVECPATAVVAAATEEAVAGGEDVMAMRDAAESEGSVQSAALGSKVRWLLDIAVVAPMIGLLGTVVGMREAFAGVQSDIEKVKPILLAGGVGKALITTAGGIVLGVMAMILYAVMRHRCDAAVSVLQTRAGRVVRILCRR